MLTLLAGCSGTVGSGGHPSQVTIAPPPPGTAPNRIVGTVTYEGAPLPGVTVTLSLTDGSSHAVATDVGGRYEFRSVPAGTYTIRFDLEGLASVTKTGRIENGHISIADAVMSLSGVSEAITVTAVAPSVIESTSVQAWFPPKPGSNAPTRRKRAASPVSVPPSYVPYGVSSQIVFADEDYAKVDEPGFKLAAEEPVSTFSIDCDTASYGTVMRYVDGGLLPPRDAVRIEEMVNYFTYSYPDPDPSEPFSINTEIADCPWRSGHKLLLVGLQGERMKAEDLPPSNLVFLLDVSGSMDMPQKLPLVKDSLKLLVEQLRPQDRVAIVVYAGAAGLVLPSTGGEDKWAILRALDRLQAGGSTAGGAGLMLAYKIGEENFVEKGNNRIILATDGDFNVGISSHADLERIIEDKRRSGVFLSVLGFGFGNYKDARLELLADKGNGNYAFVNNLAEARRILVEQMGGTLFTIAKDVKVQVEFNPVHVGAYRLIGYENRALARKDFDDDRKDAGELGAGHSVTALYEIAPPGRELDVVSRDEMRYQVSAVSEQAWNSGEIGLVRLRYKRPDENESRLLERPVADSNASLYAASDDFRFAVAVVQLGMLLRDSEHKGSAKWKDVADLAAGASAADVSRYRRGFVDLARECARLAKAGRYAERNR
jgi:Ca-activated chloride channel family protein